MKLNKLLGLLLILAINISMGFSSEIFFDDFTEPDGTLIDGYNGWSCSTTNPTIQSNEALLTRVPFTGGDDESCERYFETKTYGDRLTYQVEITQHQFNFNMGLCSGNATTSNKCGTIQGATDTESFTIWWSNTNGLTVREWNSAGGIEATLFSGTATQPAVGSIVKVIMYNDGFDNKVEIWDDSTLVQNLTMTYMTEFNVVGIGAWGGATGFDDVNISAEGEAPVVSDLTLDYPKTSYVYQIDSSDNSLVNIAGYYNSTSSILQYNFDNIGWINFTSPITGSFNETVTIGKGQGDLRVRAYNDINNTDYASITIGDIFVIAGQSNHAGRSTNLYSLDVSNNYIARVYPQTDVWSNANDILDSTDADPSNPGSPFPLIANYIIQNHDVPVIYITTAYGGTSIAQWQKGQSRYDIMIAQVEEATHGVNKVKSVLFFQGETDAILGNDYDTYKQGLIDMASDMKSDMDVEFVHIGQIAYSIPSDLHDIRKAQLDSWDDSNIVPGAVTYDIGPLADSLHMRSDAETRAFAKRWYGNIKSIVYEDGNGRGLSLNNAYLNESDELILDFNNVKGGMKIADYTNTTGTKVEGFRITDGTTTLTDTNILSTTIFDTNKLLLKLDTSITEDYNISYASTSTDGYGVDTLKNVEGMNLPMETIYDFKIGFSGISIDTILINDKELVNNTYVNTSDVNFYINTSVYDTSDNVNITYSIGLSDSLSFIYENYLGSFLIKDNVIELANTYDEGRVAYYPLKDDASEYLNSSLDGVAYNGVVFNGSEAIFDGVDLSSQRIERDRFNDVDDSKDFTICLSSKFNSFDQAILWGNGNGSSDRLGTVLNSDNSISFNHYNGLTYDKKIRYYGLSLDTWYHICSINDNGEFKLSINNDYATIEASVYAPFDVKFIIGGQSGTTRVLNGSISDVQIWNRALTESEITDIYNNQKDPNQVGSYSKELDITSFKYTNYCEITASETLNGGNIMYRLDGNSVTLNTPFEYFGDGTPVLNISMFTPTNLTPTVTNIGITCGEDEDSLDTEFVCIDCLEGSVTLTDLPDTSSSNIKFKANNFETSTSSDFFKFVVDLTTPVVTFNNNTEVNDYSFNYDILNVTCSDNFLKYCLLEFDDGTIINTTNSTITGSHTFTNNGYHTFNVTGIDYADNKNVKKGSMLINPRAYIYFYNDFGDRIEDFSFGGKNYSNYVNATIYDDIFETLGTNILTFSKVGYLKSDVTINTTLTSNINSSFTISDVDININIFYRTNSSVFTETASVTIFGLDEGITSNGSISFKNYSYEKGTYLIQVKSTGYNTEQKVIYYSGENTIEASFYLLSTTGNTSSTLTVSAEDELYNRIPNADLRLLEYDDSIFGFKEVSQCYSNIEGECKFLIEVNDKTYIISGSVEIGGITYGAVSSEDGEVFKAEILDGEVIFVEPFERALTLKILSVLTMPDLFGLNIMAYDNVEDTIVSENESTTVINIPVSWTSTNGLDYTVCLDIYWMNNGNQINFTEPICSTSASGILPVSNLELDNNYNYKAEITVTYDDKTTVYKTYYYDSNLSLREKLDNLAIVPPIILMLWVALLSFSLYAKKVYPFAFGSIVLAIIQPIIFPTYLVSAGSVMIILISVGILYIGRQEGDLS